MDELWIGNKRVLRFEEDLTINLESTKNQKRTLIATYRLDEIVGIAYVLPTFLTGGRLAICTSYAETQASTWSSIYDVKDSFEITKEDKGAVEYLLNWLRDNKGEFSKVPAGAQDSIAAENPDLPTSFLSAWKARYGEQLFWVAPPFLGQSDTVVDVISHHPGLPSLILTTTHLHQCDYSGKDSLAKWKRSETAPLIDIQSMEVHEMAFGDVQLKARLRGSAAQSKSIYGNNIVAGDLGPWSITTSDIGHSFAKVVNAEIAKHLQPASATQSSSAKEPSIADEILKLKSLLDAGAISQDEFDSLKGKLL